MKSFILQQVAEELKKHSTIRRALRVDENIILLQLDNNRYYFDLTRGEGEVYIDISYPVVKRFYAPFDRILERKFTRAQLVSVKSWERFLIIGGENRNSFKRELFYLRLEFTGRYTNGIILNPEGIVVEALRHIPPEKSIRIVMPGTKLEEPPAREIREHSFPIEDLKKWTQQRFKEKYHRRLKQAKERALNRLGKQLTRVKKRLEELGQEREFLERASKYRQWGELILANLSQIKPYQSSIRLVDWEGKAVEIPLPSLPNPNKIGEFYFKQAKKLENRAKNLKIERTYLKEQVNFLENYRQLIEQSDSFPILKRYFPKREKRDGNIHRLEIEGFQILIGKNERGNRELLKSSKGEDIWLHIRDYPGPHVIIKNRRLGIPMEVVREGAKLAIQFAGREEGIVDYTRRKFVKVKEGAKVEYGKYSSIWIKS